MNDTICAIYFCITFSSPACCTVTYDGIATSPLSPRLPRRQPYAFLSKTQELSQIEYSRCRNLIANAGTFRISSIGFRNEEEPVLFWAVISIVERRRKRDRSDTNNMWIVNIYFGLVTCLHLTLEKPRSVLCKIAGDMFVISIA